MSGSGFPLAPGAVIGILGGGQLGRMLAMAAARLGFDVAILTPETDSPAGRVAAHAIVGAYDDEAALAELARLSDAVTFEFENVPAAVVARLQALGMEVAPGPKALAVAQDRVAEKSFFVEVGELHRMLERMRRVLRRRVRCEQSAQRRRVQPRSRRPRRDERNGCLQIGGRTVPRPLRHLLQERQAHEEHEGSRD